MKYHVFYSFQESREEQLDDEALEMDVASAIKLLDKMTTDGDFLGFIDSENNTLQILYDEDNGVYWTEIPEPAKQGSHGTVFTREELEKTLKGLKPQFKVGDYPMFEFEEWDLEDEEEE